MIKKYISECTDYDFKLDVEKRKPKSWLKTISAFANSYGGTLLFGIANDRNIIGIDNPQLASDYISEVINKRIKPTPNYILTPIKDDEKVILLVKVYSGNATLYYYDYDGIKEAYIRSGNERIVTSHNILNDKMVVMVC